VSKYKVGEVSDDQLTADLSALGYQGFSHYKPSRLKNPADVLLSGLKPDKRDARLMEAMPWLVLKFPDMKWSEVARTAKMYDLQNRLGFVVSVARGMAEKRSEQYDCRRIKTARSLLGAITARPRRHPLQRNYDECRTPLAC
jgi:hypothetical protein